MADKFDPYAEWLGIEDKQRPLTNYQLLGLAPFTADADAIEGHEQQQLAKLVRLFHGEHALQAKRIAFEIKSAKTCLLNPTTKASYDAALRGGQSQPSGTQPVRPVAGESRPPRPQPLPTVARPTPDPRTDRKPELEDDCYALAQPERRVDRIVAPIIELATPESPNRFLQQRPPSRPKKSQWLVPAVIGGAVVVVAGIGLLIAWGQSNAKAPDAPVGKTYNAGEPTKPQPPGANGPRPNVPTLPPAPSAAERQTMRILVDVYQTRRTPDIDNVVRKIGMPNKGVIMNTIAQPLTTDSLRSTDILVVTHCSKPKAYGVRECDAVAQYVRNGGGLLIVANTWVGMSYEKYSEQDYPPNQIGTRFGFLMRGSYAQNPARFVSHPITGGLRDLNWSRDVGVGSAITVSDNVIPLVFDSKMNVLCAVKEYGKGRVCMMAWNHAVRGCNEQCPEYVRFLKQVLGWLAEPQSTRLAATAKNHDDESPPMSSFSIVSARWGVGNRWTDVTSKVRALVQNDSLSFMVPADGGDLGFPDPAAGQRKNLAVTYFYAGSTRTKIVKAGEQMELPSESDMPEDETNQPPALQPPVPASKSAKRQPKRSNTPGDSMASASQNRSLGLVQINLPSGAQLTEAMLNAPNNWKEAFFAEEKNAGDHYAHVELYDNKQVFGIFTMKEDSLDGAAATLHENGRLQTLTFYDKARCHDCLRLWDQNGMRLFYACYHKGNKHGVLCFFRDGVPWLIEEWNRLNKKAPETRYLVTWPRDGSSAPSTAQLIDSESEEMAKACEQLAELEATITTNEKSIKQKLATWYHNEEKRYRKELAPKVSAANRDATIKRNIIRNAQRDESMKALMRSAIGRAGL